MACQIQDGKYYAENGNPSKLYNDLREKVGEVQANDLFVLAYTPKFINDVQAPLIWNYKNKFPETPYHLDFKENVSAKARTIQQFENGEYKGKLTLSPYQDGYKVKTVSVNKENQGKGLEKSLYVYTIRQLIAEGKNLYEVSANDYFEENELPLEENTIYAKPLSAFDANGEIQAESVLNYATELNEVGQELSFAEQEEVKMMLAEFPYIEDSYELSDKLAKAFYKDGLFSPTRQSLNELYSNYEIDNILSDVSVLGQVKESIEKLARTPNFLNSANLQATYKTNELNSFGKLKTENPYVISQDIVEEYGGIDQPDLSEIKDPSITAEYLQQFKRIPVIDNFGNPIIEQIIYPSAVKVVDDTRVFEAIDAIWNAPTTVDTSRLEQKLTNWLLDYGINIEGFSKDLLPSLEQFLLNPTLENIQNYSDKYREVFDIPVKVREKVTKIEDQDRDLVYLETNRTEQELFDEQNLLQTELSNIYHKIERVDFQQMKEAFNLSDDITELQAYKDYFGYNIVPIKETQQFTPITFKNSYNYLTNEFIADFNIEKLKNPEHSFYKNFKITEKGIEQTYKDPISTAGIKAYIADGIKLGDKLAEYSVLSKQMDTLLETEEQPVATKFNNRVYAVNNFESVPLATGDFTKLNLETLIVKNGTQEFVKNENELFELIGKNGNLNIYSRIQKNENLDYNDTNPTAPADNLNPLKFNINQLENYSNIKKQWKSADIGDKFSCF